MSPKNPIMGTLTPGDIEKNYTLKLNDPSNYRLDSSTHFFKIQIIFEISS